MENKSKKTMNELYGESSNHLACEKCGLCITCKDCTCRINKAKELNL